MTLRCGWWLWALGRDCGGQAVRSEGRSSGSSVEQTGGTPPYKYSPRDHSEQRWSLDLKGPLAAHGPRLTPISQRDWKQPISQAAPPPRHSVFPGSSPWASGSLLFSAGLCLCLLITLNFYLPSLSSSLPPFHSSLSLSLPSSSPPPL